MTPLEQERLTTRFNQWYASQKGTTGVIDVPQEFRQEFGDNVVWNGVLYQRETYNAVQQQNADVSAGKLKNIGTVDKPLYVPTGTVSMASNSAPSSDSFGKKLGPAEYKNLREQNKVTDKNFDQYFMRDGNGNIYINPRGALGTAQQGQATGGTTTPPAPQAGGTTTSTQSQPLPDWVTNDPQFKALSPDNKELVKTQWNAIQSSDALFKMRAQKAIQDAIPLADPAYKQALLLAKDSLERNLSEFLKGNEDAKAAIATKLANLKEKLISDAAYLNNADVQARISEMENIRTVSDQAVREGSSREAGVAAEIARTQRRIDAVQQDLQYGKQDISLEEQAQLGRQLKEYQRNLQTTQEQAVDAGMGFSSIRAQAEQRLAEDLSYVTESTKRQSTRQQRILETQSGRDTAELVASKADIERKNQEERTALAREMEQKLGWDKVPSELKALIPNLAPLGFVNPATGQMSNLQGEAAQIQAKRELELKKQQDDMARQQKQAEADVAAQQQSLERQREEGVAKLEAAAEQVMGSTETAKVTPGAKLIGGISGTIEQQRKQDVATIANADLKTLTPQQV